MLDVLRSGGRYEESDALLLERGNEPTLWQAAVSAGLATDGWLLEATARRYGLARATLDEVDPRAADLLDEGFVRQQRAVPVGAPIYLPQRHLTGAETMQFLRLIPMALLVGFVLMAVHGGGIAVVRLFAAPLLGRALDRFGIQNLALYVSGQNLLTFSKYKISDPEIQNFTRMPTLRSFLAGVLVAL